LKTIACLKHGDKYSAEYVNTLYCMAKRNCSFDFSFVCFTENKNDLHPDIKAKPLPELRGARGWWYKPLFFNPQLGIEGTLLFFDLDVIIFRDIDKLFTHKPGEFCIIRDFHRHVNPKYAKFNSSVFRLEIGSQAHIYENFVRDPKNIMRRFHGDQDWIFSQAKNYAFWPDEWIQSYKWEMRGKPKMVRDKKGKRNFVSPGEPKILDETAVAVFHGEPNPKDCVDQWCKLNWK